MLTGYLWMNGWQGITKTLVEIIGATPKKYRIRAISRTKIAGRSRWLEIGKTALVPQYAVRDHCSYCHGEKGGVPGNENLDQHGKPICDYCWLENKEQKFNNTHPPQQGG